MKVLVWNEFVHEKKKPEAAKLYPNGIHTAIAEFLSQEEDFTVETATLDDAECGLTEEKLAKTDVLIWWGHTAHQKVPDEIAFRVRDAVQKGMGFIALHSAHHSKPFRYLMGTSCNLGWREDGDSERLWVVDPTHPIMQGIDRYIELLNEETYCEFFDIPQPDSLLMIGHYDGGEAFRSACCFQRGYGKIFYFQPGHETYPTFYIPEVQTIIKNAVRWAKPTSRLSELTAPKIAPVVCK